jgi:hypothetical protein
MHPRYQSVIVFLAAVLFGCSAAYADTSTIVRADQFVAALQRNSFEEAARLFHYPPSYTGEELSRERSGITGFLRTLLAEIGDIDTISRVPLPAGEFLTLGESAGDIPYWSSHPELSKVENVVYRANVKRDGEVYFVVSLIRPVFAWEVRSFTLHLSASRPGAAERMSQLARKLAPPTKPAEKGA